MNDLLTIPVLMFHSVDTRSSPQFRRYTIDPALFEDQVAALMDGGCTALTASELAAVRSGALEMPSRPVALTFDDAFHDFVSYALPVLKSAGMAATVFVPTGFVGSTSRWLVAEREQRRRLMSWRDLAELPASRVEVAAHGHSHQQMDLLDSRAAAREIALCKALLEDQVQQPIRAFGYPFGYSNSKVRDLVAAQGFDVGFAVGDMVSSGQDRPFAIPRLTVTPDTTPEDVWALTQSRRNRGNELRSRSRAVVSRVLRSARVRKRSNAPERAPAAASSA